MRYCTHDCRLSSYTSILPHFMCHQKLRKYLLWPFLTSQFNVQSNKKIIFGYLAIRLLYKKFDNKALKLSYMVCCFYLFIYLLNLKPAFEFPLQKSCVSCEEGAQRLLPTSSSPSGCFPPTVPVDRNLRWDFPHSRPEGSYCKRDADHNPGRKKKIILIPTWDFWNDKQLGYLRRNEKT